MSWPPGNDEMMIVDDWVLNCLEFMATYYCTQWVSSAKIALRISLTGLPQRRNCDVSDCGVQPMNLEILPPKMRISPEMMVNYRGNPWKPIKEIPP